MCCGGYKNFAGTLKQPRPDEFGMRQQCGEYFAPNPMLFSFGMDLALKFGGEDQQNKKRSSSQNVDLDHVHSICLAVSSKKSVCGNLFLGKSLLVLLCWYKSLLSIGGNKQ